MTPALLLCEIDVKGWAMRDTPWTDHQSITGLSQRARQPFTLTLTPMSKLLYLLTLSQH